MFPGKVWHIMGETLFRNMPVTTMDACNIFLGLEMPPNNCPY